MKKTIFAIIVFILAVNLSTVSAQSRRITAPTSTEKLNRRPAAAPTPSPEPISEEELKGGKVQDDGTVVSVATEIVTVPVRVMDRKGRFIAGLAKENFKVFEDGVEQQIEFFTNESQPFTVALVLDMSYSSTFKLAEIQSAAIEFIGQLRPVDKVMVVSFDKELHVLCELTSDRQQIYKAINSAKITTGTSLYEAVDLVVNDRLRKVEGRKAMVLFTDGVDTTSENSSDVGNLRNVSESEVLVYPIRYDTYADVQRMQNRLPTDQTLPGQLPKSTPPTMPTKDPSGLPFPIPMIGMPSSKGTSREEYDHAEQFLTELANRTGGRIYLASTIGNLSDAFKKIAGELREYYSIGYYPAQRVPGQTMKLKVTVDHPDSAVRARASYVVPKKSSARK
ncbi:MAG: VWA domain-containing protein [Pyrinomonadaceae bacterium]